MSFDDLWMADTPESINVLLINQGNHLWSEYILRRQERQGKIEELMS